MQMLVSSETTASNVTTGTSKNTWSAHRSRVRTPSTTNPTPTAINARVAIGTLYAKANR